MNMAVDGFRLRHFLYFLYSHLDAIVVFFPYLFLRECFIFTLQA
jgi:hypothetical protein